MNWFENNPVGRALAWTCGGLAGFILLMAWAWHWPVSSNLGDDGEASGQVAPVQTAVTDLGPVSEYRVINDRPVFNESRQPVVSIEEDGETIELVEAPVADAPDVRLTGVIITPEQRMATLSQNRGGDALIAHEGNPLDGEYVGWTVASIEPRMVRLESLEGESLELQLSVHDQVIKEPPRPEPPPEEQLAQEGEGEAGAEDGEQLSRAEEIRRRIAERREQLRREADQERSEENEATSSQRNEYQQAIQSMLQKSRSTDNDEQDESGSDNDD
jgi:general secretion pathway protein N